MDTHPKRFPPGPTRMLLFSITCLPLAGCAGYAGLIPLTLQSDGAGNVSAGVGHLGLALAPGLATADCRATCLQRAEDGTTCMQYLRDADTACTGALGHK